MRLLVKIKNRKVKDMPIYNISNVASNRYLNINGSNFLGTDLTSNIYNVNIWSHSSTPEQKWYLPSLETNKTTYIRSYMNDDTGLNLVTTSNNCSIHMIPGNERDAQVELINVPNTNYYKIRLKNSMKYSCNPSSSL